MMIRTQEKEAGRQGGIGDRHTPVGSRLPHSESGLLTRTDPEIFPDSGDDNSATCEHVSWGERTPAVGELGGATMAHVNAGNRNDGFPCSCTDTRRRIDGVDGVGSVCVPLARL